MSEAFAARGRAGRTCASYSSRARARTVQLGSRTGLEPLIGPSASCKMPHLFDFLVN